MLSRIERLRLLLAPFSHSQINAFIAVARLPPALPSDIEDWREGRTFPNHPFFDITEIARYLDVLADDAAVIGRAHEVHTNFFSEICPHLDFEPNMAYLQTTYDSLLNQRPDVNYQAVERMRCAGNVYYSDRFQDAFLTAHYWVLAHHLGARCAQALFHRLLSISLENDGAQITFPAIDLSQGDGHLGVAGDIANRVMGEVDDVFLHAVRSTGMTLENNPTFAIDRVSEGEVHCCVSNYFNALCQCDKFYYYMVGAYPGYPSDGFDEYKRSRVMSDWANQLKRMVLDNDFQCIDASIGASCLFVYQTDTGYKMLLSKKQPDANGFSDLHVIPALMFQPLGNSMLNDSQELNVMSHVLREVAEELFGYPEVSASGAGNWVEQVDSYPEIQALNQCFKTGTAEYHSVGMSLDLFRLRPEWLTTIIVHDVEWAKTYLHDLHALGNWEVQKGGVISLDMNDANFKKIVSGDVGYLCAPGAACLVNGYKLFKNL